MNDLENNEGTYQEYSSLIGRFFTSDICFLSLSLSFSLSLSLSAVNSNEGVFVAATENQGDSVVDTAEEEKGREEKGEAKKESEEAVDDPLSVLLQSPRQPRGRSKSQSMPEEEHAQQAPVVCSGGAIPAEATPRPSHLLDQQHPSPLTPTTPSTPSVSRKKLVFAQRPLSELYEAMDAVGSVSLNLVIITPCVYALWLTCVHMTSLVLLIASSEYLLILYQFVVGLRCIWQH